MSENTPETGRPVVEKADLTICFHGSTVMLAKEERTGESLIALRISGHPIGQNGEPETDPDITTYEIIMNSEESISMIFGILSGVESLASKELQTTFEDLLTPRTEWN